MFSWLMLACTPQSTVDTPPTTSTTTETTSVTTTTTETTTQTTQTTTVVTSTQDSDCGDTVCQPTEDADSCPFDCVPIVIGNTGKVCDRTHMGFVPLTEIGAGTYLSVAQGGLYPGGSNDRPSAHGAEGIARAEAMANDGLRHCLISIGMSNTNQKWNAFMGEAARNLGPLNPDLVIANGAVGGNPVDTTADPNHGVWRTIDSQIARVGCYPEDVYAVWLLHAERGPTGDFPSSAEFFEDHLRDTVVNLADRYTNLSMVFLSSRVYAGYGDFNNNPEPYAHQGAFSVKWLIEGQIDGTDPALDLAAGAPWLSWGPYVWADGLGADDVVGGIPGRTVPDSLEYECDDFSDTDGIHPGNGVLDKVTARLSDFFLTDPAAAPFFLP